MSDNEEWLAAFVVVFIGLGILGIGVHLGRLGYFNEAEIVKHHAAHYEMDPATGVSTFHWNDQVKQ